jgi:AraC-like DNA-binding protein
MSPRDYIISKKTELAKELLQSEKYSVTDVAISLGYSDIYQFSKMFKLKTGCNPSEYKHQSL